MNDCVLARCRSVEMSTDILTSVSADVVLEVGGSRKKLQACSKQLLSGPALSGAERPQHVGGSGGILPQKILRFSEMQSEAF